MFIPLPYLQQLLEQLNPLRLKVTRIHQLLVMLPQRAQVAFLRNELGGFVVVGFQEVDGLLPFCTPEFILVIPYSTLVTSYSTDFRSPCMAEGLLSSAG